MHATTLKEKGIIGKNTEQKINFLLFLSSESYGFVIYKLISIRRSKRLVCI